MQRLLTEYAHYWNKEHGHTGHVFRNRFTCKPVLTDSHLLNTARYIDLNPYRAQGMVERPEDWPWSSLRAHLGLEYRWAFHSADSVLRCLSTVPQLARREYERFVREGQRVSDTVTEVSPPRPSTAFGSSWPSA
jgi:hypothetical protein